MNWIEDSAIREWVCKADDNVFWTKVTYQWGLDSYRSRVYMNIFHTETATEAALIAAKNFGDLESAKTWAEATLRDISAQAIALADSQNQ
jgi:hypothetical protein